MNTPRKVQIREDTSKIIEKYENRLEFAILIVLAFLVFTWLIVFGLFPLTIGKRAIFVVSGLILCLLIATCPTTNIYTVLKEIFHKHRAAGSVLFFLGFGVLCLIIGLIGLVTDPKLRKDGNGGTGA